MNISQLLKEVIIIVLIALVVGMTVNHFSPSGLSLTSLPEQLQFTESSEFPVIEAAEARQRQQAGRHVFVDARSRANYENGHIPGAVLLPTYEVDDYIFPFFDDYPLDTPLVIYCSDIGCSDSHVLAAELSASGYMDITIFAGGMDAWRKQAYPVEKNG